MVEDWLKGYTKRMMNAVVFLRLLLSTSLFEFNFLPFNLSVCFILCFCARSWQVPRAVIYCVMVVSTQQR